ncbi:MAG: efflux RND transporter periplasmic adaptor subunit, partial [Planctomycetota bacterium]|nr:efflux RND transporter periplasmic adaptor subunit [Planctomycetota bacterium]
MVLPNALNPDALQDALPRATLGQRSQSRPGDTSSKPVLVCLVVFGLLCVASLAFIFLPSTSQKKPDYILYTVGRGDLRVSVTEQGTLESSDNTEIKCKVRGKNTITWVIEGGTQVKAGDKLLQLDTLALDEAISERIKYAYLTRSSAERLKGNVRAAELSIQEYLEGRFQTELKTLEKELAVAKSNLQKTQDLETFTAGQVEKGFANQLSLEQLQTSVSQSRQTVLAKTREIELLKTYTKEEELETLKGDLAAAQKSYEAEFERSKADVARRDRAIDELKHCTVVAPRDGLVIKPKAQPWERVPDIEEGATVHKEQLLLLMPDLSKMQVKVGVHESVIDRVEKGQVAHVTLARQDLTAEVSDVARVAKPAAWWSGNLVKYDTIISLPESTSLKPGMSAEVEIVLAEYKDIVTIPVAAVVESGQGTFCWVQKEGKL